MTCPLQDEPDIVIAQPPRQVQVQTPRTVISLPQQPHQQPQPIARTVSDDDDDILPWYMKVIMPEPEPDLRPVDISPPDIPEPPLPDVVEAQIPEYMQDMLDKATQRAALERIEARERREREVRRQGYRRMI